MTFCVCTYMWHKKFFIFYFGYGILEANVISAGFAYRIWLIFSFFLKWNKLFSKLCATCPKIKIFIWDNILVLRVLKYDFLCMYGHVAQKIFIFYFRYGILEANVISAGFAYRIWLIFSFFLKWNKSFPKLCATCPKIKIFIWDNTLISKV